MGFFCYCKNKFLAASFKAFLDFVKNRLWTSKMKVKVLDVNVNLFNIPYESKTDLEEDGRSHQATCLLTAVEHSVTDFP